jgi:hypothetical protein
LGVSGKLKGQAASATERERRIRERPGPSRQVGQQRRTNMSCGSSTNLAAMPIQSRYADGASRPDDLHCLVQNDGGLVAASVALGFETHCIDDRIDRGFADDRSYMLAEAIVLAEIYQDEANVSGVALAALRSCRQS